MDAKVVYYLYSETILTNCFSEDNKPAVLCDLTKEYSLNSQRIFRECGGLKIKDYFKNDKTHVRMSFWQTAGGYQKWCENEKTINYLRARAEYQRSKQIVELLEGPFEGSLND